MRLDGKVALVTGAGRGLGRAYALRLAELGADVAINDISLNSAAQIGEVLTASSVGAEVRSRGVRCIEVESDVADQAAISSAVGRVVDELGSLDILVCNAGGLFEDPATSYISMVSAGDMHTVLERNFFGTLYSCQAAIGPMKQRGWGKIVTVTSTAALRSAPDGWYGSYAAAKAAIISLTMNLAEELGPHGITVNAISPGYVHTHRLLARVKDAEADLAAAQRIALRRWGRPEDCANVIEFLCTPLSDYVTGQVIVVDGGLTLRDAS